MAAECVEPVHTRSQKNGTFFFGNNFEMCAPGDRRGLFFIQFHPSGSD